jgi:hypothetical protein
MAQKWYKQYQVDLPEGQSGDWKVEKFTVTKEGEQLEMLRAAFNPQRGGRYTPAGDYTWLKRGNTTVMSDTPDEISDHLSAIHRAKGHCNGLGLGVVVQAMLNNPEVEHVTVVEIDPDVIKLVGSYYKERYGDRLTIVEADAFEYKHPVGIPLDVVWHDIWDTICSDNLPEMHKLYRSYGKKTRWQGSWCRELCEWQREIGW